MFDRHVVVETDDSFYQKKALEKEKKIKKGLIIFNRDCSMCHQKGKKRIDLLANLNQRMTKKYFALYITKHDSLIKSGDPYARQMAKDWNNAAPKHDYIYTNEELDCLTKYVMQ
jgi:hypothetical protein